MRVVLVVNTTSVHHTFSVEKFQVRGDENSVLLQGFGADLFAILVVCDLAVYTFLFQQIGQLCQVSIHDEPIALPHGGLQIVVGDQGCIVNLAFSSIRVAISLFLCLLLSIIFLVFPLLSLVFLWELIFVYDNFLISIVVCFGLIKVIAIVILGEDHLSIIQCFDKLLKWRHSILLGFFYQEFDNINHNVGIKSSIVLLRFSQGTPLPVGHLLDFTDALVEDLLSHLGKSSLLLNQEDFTVEGLSVNKILHVLDEIHVGQFAREEICVRAEIEIHDCQSRVAQYLIQHGI